MRIENIENRLADHAAMLAARARKYLNPDKEVLPSELEQLSETESEVGSALASLNDTERKLVIAFTAQEWVESQEIIREVQEAILAVLNKQDPNQDTKV